MSFTTKLILFFALNFCVMLYTVFKTRKSNFSSDTKNLLYVMAVVTPFFGLLLFFIKNYKQKKYAA